MKPHKTAPPEGTAWVQTQKPVGEHEQANLRLENANHWP